jgi:hypothetical protein
MGPSTAVGQVTLFWVVIVAALMGWRIVHVLACFPGTWFGASSLAEQRYTLASTHTTTIRSSSPADDGAVTPLGPSAVVLGTLSATCSQPHIERSRENAGVIRWFEYVSRELPRNVIKNYVEPRNRLATTMPLKISKQSEINRNETKLSFRRQHPLVRVRESLQPVFRDELSDSSVVIARQYLWGWVDPTKANPYSRRSCWYCRANAMARKTASVILLFFSARSCNAYPIATPASAVVAPIKGT